MARTSAAKTKEKTGTKAGKQAEAAGKTTGSTKSKAQLATSFTEEELRRHRRNALAGRLLASILLVFLSLFLFLSMFGVHAVVLDFFSNLANGLLGYGFWVLPFGCLYMAWLLFFLHEEPVKGRILATLALVACISALIHTLICRIGFSFGMSMFKNLWETGIDHESGGVIPGLISQLLQSGISRVGTVPVLLLLMAVLIFMMFRLSAAAMIHNRAEKRREKLQAYQEEQLDEVQPEPVVYDTRADLRVLATPVVRPRVQMERITRQTNFDLPIGNGAARGNRERKRGFLDELREDSEPLFEAETPQSDEDLLFGGKRRKRNKKQSAKEPVLTTKESSPYDIDFEIEPREGSGQDLYVEHNSLDYTAQVQELVRQEQEAPRQENPQFSWEMDGETMSPQLTMDQPRTAPAPAKKIDESDLEVTKEKKISHDEAEIAAAEVALEIEARSDAETQEKPAYQYPPMSMLAEAMGSKNDNTEEMRTNVRRLEETLESFGVDSKINNVVRGPAVTRYEMELKPGVKMNKITSLHEDIALSLGVTSVHVAAVPGKSSTIGIEVPNSIVTSVPIKEVLESREFKTHKSALAFAAGKDISGNYIIGDIAKMPHLLIAGTTGSGKSVCMNSIIVSLLYRDSPEQCRLIMIDPKIVELSIYNGVPHLLIPVVTDAKKAAGALQWAVTEMERRYKCFEDAHVRELSGYNKRAEASEEMEPMPRIVIIIDELADLMMVAAKEVETSIARLAAKARAAGMHLVIATQRPSADVITGVIKANIPSRIAFAVSSAMESNIIMGTRGAEKLLGKGDMFYAPQGTDKPKRVQGCFISDEEVEKVAEFVKNSSEADYSDDILNEIEQNAASASGADIKDDTGAVMDVDGDPQLADAVEVVLDTKQASVSMLQRRLKLGYAHAARIMDEMEEKGIVGPFEGSKPRQLLITREQWSTMVGINPRAVAGASADTEPVPDDIPFELEDDVI